MAEWCLEGEGAMKQFGAALMRTCDAVGEGGIIGLEGDLGSGKTTLVRGALAEKGVVEGVRSPTYTLIEVYPLQPLNIAHFDLYRLGDPDELEYLGFRDYLDERTLCLIEWPERARGYLQGIDLTLKLDYAAQGQARRIRPQAAGERGKNWLQSLGRF